MISEWLEERITNFKMRTGRTPKFIILSQIEISKLRMGLYEKTKHNEIYNEIHRNEPITEFMGITIYEAKDGLMPEEM